VNRRLSFETVRYGVPPHGGYGMGIDRLVRLVADLGNVEEAILFPRDPDRLEP
jgi:aspartyl-tRNA synthetase